MGLGWGLGDMRVVISNGLERLKLVGRYRVNSVRLIVDLDETWDRVRESMSRRWGHLDAAADGAGRLDQVSEAEAIEIATRHLKPEDDDATRAGQIAAAVDFARYVAMDRDSQIRATKWRGGRIFVPGLSLRKEARQELFRFSGEQLVKCDARCAYWWILCAEIRRALLLTRETQTLSDQIKTTRRIENIERLLCLASSGQFYKFFADRCGIDVDLVKSRINMLCLFNDNNFAIITSCLQISWWVSAGMFYIFQPTISCCWIPSNSNTVQKVINFPRYNMKCSGRNEIVSGMFHEL